MYIEPLTLAWSISHVQILVTFTVRVLRMRLFHPLRRYPGPWLNSITQIPAAWALLRARQPKAYRELHEKYG